MVHGVELPRHRLYADGVSPFDKPTQGAIGVDVCISSALHGLAVLSQMHNTSG